jgi:predicted nucleic acid-binding protein
MEAFIAGKWGRGLLLEYVFLEVVTVLLMRRDLSVATQVGRILLDARELELIPCSDLFIDVLRMFSEQSLTRLSFADAAVATVARQRADGFILSFDGEFHKIQGLQVVPSA